MLLSSVRRSSSLRSSSVFARCALIIGFTTVTFAQSSSKQIIDGSNATLPFSVAVKAGGFIYVSGTIGSNQAMNDV